MQQINDAKLRAHFLQRSDFLQCFSFDAAPYTQLYHAEATDYIVSEGAQLHHLFYLVAGRAKLYLTLPNGKVSLIDFFKAPCFVGEMELLGIQRQSRAVQALVPCYCLALPVDRCRQQLLQDARFLRRLCDYLGSKNYRTVLSLSQIKGFPLENRLAQFVLIAAPEGWYREKHGHAAEYLGVSYRHLLYVLADFVRLGYIAKDEGGYRIADRPALLSLAREMDPQWELP